MLTTRTHQLAKKSRLLPSSPQGSSACSSPHCLGDKSRTLRGGRIGRRMVTESGSSFLLPGILSGELSPVGGQPSAFPGSGTRPVPWGLLEHIPASAGFIPFSQALCTPSPACNGNSEPGCLGGTAVRAECGLMSQGIF
ncbi:hypothetical protein HJG60_009249 [Phyllostomus discolor]|uniref:Uncharacterized protein n=1 Tax=Phyllostomus discolor TaxID=89673 RepID=A0A833YSL0_9CHIR|nr:hypothetical protein HJG60_009249 [Phyllostomus discolor]